MKTYFPQPPRMYSTSTSDSEEAAVKERKDNLSNFSQSRNSLASNSSTLTARSSNSSVLRRNRNRSSALSVRSSASDRTITEESPSRRNSVPGLYSKKSESLKSSSYRRGKEEYSLPETASAVAPVSAFKRIEKANNVLPVELKSNNNKINQGSSDKDFTDATKSRKKSDKVSDLESLPTDPTAIAKRILAETHGQRLALENFQRKSLEELREKHRVESKENLPNGNEIEKKVDFSTSERTDHLLNSILTKNNYENETATDILNSEANSKVAAKIMQDSPTRKVRDEIMEIQLQKLGKGTQNSNENGQESTVNHDQEYKHGRENSTVIIETNLDETDHEIKTQHHCEDDDLSYVLHKKEGSISSTEKSDLLTEQNPSGESTVYEAQGQPKMYQNVNTFKLQEHQRFKQQTDRPATVADRRPDTSTGPVVTERSRPPTVPQKPLASAVMPLKIMTYNATSESVSATPSNVGPPVTLGHTKDIKTQLGNNVSGSNQHNFRTTFGQGNHLIKTTAPPPEHTIIPNAPNVSVQYTNNVTHPPFVKQTIETGPLMNSGVDQVIRNQSASVYPAPEDISFCRNPQYGSDSDSDSPYKRNTDGQVPWYLTGESTTNPKVVGSEAIKSDKTTVRYSSKIGPPPPYSYKHEFNKELAEKNVLNKLPLTPAYSSHSDSDSSTSSHSDQLRSLSSVMYSDGRLVGQVAPQPRVNNHQNKMNLANIRNKQVGNNRNPVSPHYSHYQPAVAWNQFNARSFMGAARSIDTIPENTEESDVSSIDTRLSAADLSDRSGGSRASLASLTNQMQLHRLSDSHSGSDSSLNRGNGPNRSVGYSPPEQYRADDSNRTQTGAVGLALQNVQNFRGKGQNLSSILNGYMKGASQAGSFTNGNLMNMPNAAQKYGNNVYIQDGLQGGNTNTGAILRNNNIFTEAQIHTVPSDGNIQGEGFRYTRPAVNQQPKGILKNSVGYNSHGAQKTPTPPTSSPRHAYSSDSDTPSQGSVRSSSSLSGQNKVVRLPPSKPNGPIRMFVMDDSNSVPQKDRVFQLSKC